MRTRNMLLRAALGIAAALVLGGVTPASAQPPDALMDARFYTGALGSQGVFPGKLVCLCCDFQGPDASKAACKEDSHHYALKIEGDPVPHPLVPGDATAMKQLSSAEMHDKHVSVTGKLYPSVGIILVSGITAQK